MDEGAAPEVKTAVIEQLARRARKARFVPEVTAALARANAGSDEVERAIGELETDGIVIVREHYCGDPHLEGMDLRVVALVDQAVEDVDPRSKAIADIDATWDQWVSDYLANHRCS